MTAVLCACLAAGLGLVWSWAHARRFSLERRIAPRLRGSAAVPSARTPLARMIAPVADDLARLASRWGAPTDEVARRLARAGLRTTVARHRAQALAAGAAGLAAGLALGLLVGVVRGTGPGFALVVAVIGAVLGALAPDLLLARRAAARAGRIRAELPAAAEMLALAVVAGESVPGALDRVASLSPGPLGDELRTALAEIRAGRSVGSALDGLAARVGEPGVTSFCDAIVTALERGTPLAEVLHSQATDVRDRSRQSLLEEGGKREIAMLVPVVLLIMPVTVLFALYPGLVALRLGF
ncbi:type II secretion system F family protein [Demequina sp. SYSU T00192]|uniref:Type II secretion system F family protein n=1 Tax=Demequina litoralis TaxID=3051660 RepID=A0ABT8GBV0_9MICO|nr:type II secretion system F family protein [Demequina sp. SYSU T00192]MDN4476626.1 type II secretion system F family protein [Demequina sp. SYSU T00192]